jgi:hypothetical protein
MILKPTERYRDECPRPDSQHAGDFAQGSNISVRILAAIDTVPIVRAPNVLDCRDAKHKIDRVTSDRKRAYVGLNRSQSNTARRSEIDGDQFRHRQGTEQFAIDGRRIRTTEIKHAALPAVAAEYPGHLDHTFR